MAAHDEEQKPERRREYLNLMDVMVHLEHLLEAHEAKDDARYGELRATVDNWVAESVRRLESVESGFPDGPDNHRAYHAEKIQAAKDEAEFWRAAKLKVVEVGVSGIWTVIKIITALSLAGLAVKFGVALPSWLGGKP